MTPPVTDNIKCDDLLNVNSKCGHTTPFISVKNNDVANPHKELEETVVSEEANLASSLASLSTESNPFRIATLVFFDIETTGLAHKVGKKNVQITEISMIAVDRNDFFKSIYPDLRDTRIVHKLSLCVRPTCRVSAGAAKLTGYLIYFEIYH